MAIVLPLSAYDSTYMECTFRTSSRVLRILTESEDNIRDVFFPLAGLRPVILDIEASGGLDFSSLDFVRFQVSKLDMSLDQSALAILSPESSSGWTVYSSGVNSWDSGVAIS